MKPINNCEVVLWNEVIGYVSWNKEERIAYFQYSPQFLKNNSFSPAPLEMPLNEKSYNFPTHRDQEGFMGLPGMLSDSLPDKYGHAVIDEWLSRQGRDKASFTPIERLCYIGSRGMGALEYRPVLNKTEKSTAEELDLEVLIEFSNEILQKRETLNGETSQESKLTATMNQILAIGSTAGGARAKCVVAWNRKENIIRSGQLNAPEGYTQWLLKLDGVDKNGDKGLNDPKGYLNIEYAYHLMALDCGIYMTQTEQLIEKGRYHFITRRFDRPEGKDKLHMSTVHGIAHMDYNKQFIYSYESVVDIMRKIIDSTRLPSELEQFFKRAVFNIIGVNQDDHTKNITFVMDRSGNWFLSPAYDLSWNENPSGWTNQHQLQLNRKTKDHRISDLISFAKYCGLSKNSASKIIDLTFEVFSDWRAYAKKASLHKSQPEFIEGVENSLNIRKRTLNN